MVDNLSDLGISSENNVTSWYKKIFCSTLSEFENFLLCERILKVLSNLEPLRGSSNKKTLYSTCSCINWAFFGTRGPLKRSLHSRFKMAHACQKRPNLHTNSSNNLLFLRDDPTEILILDC
jgi:hypothetical protein